MRLKLEAWDPDQSGAWEEEARPALAGRPVETPWAPVSDALTHPGPWVFVDGVERAEAFVRVEGRSLGLLFSYAVGAVLRDAGGVTFAEPLSVRRVFLAPEGEDLILGPRLAYTFHRTPELDHEGLLQRARALRRRDEWALGETWARRVPEALVIHDGPLFYQPESGGKVTKSRIGYVKSHYQSYLAPEHQPILAALKAGERTPVFAVPPEARRTPRAFFSWYIRLPLHPSTPYSAASGLVRVETDAEGSEEAILLARYALDALVRLASEPYRDPRAPSNLVPVGGLERELRRRMGSRELIRRAVSRWIAG